jgi:hypothetical protein
MKTRELFVVAVIFFLLGILACHVAVQQIKPALADSTPWTGKKYEQKCEYVNNSIEFKWDREAINSILYSNGQKGWRLTSVALMTTKPFLCFVRD